MNIVAGSLFVSLALILTAARPIVVPGSICAAPDGLRVGDAGYFAATCSDEVEKLAVDSGLILFAFDRYRLSSSAWLTIHIIHKKIMADTGSYSVEGHADIIGTESYNLKLSVKRANAVRDALISLGVPSNRLIPRGFGESRPIARSDNAAGRALNRRVEARGVEVRPAL